MNILILSISALYRQMFYNYQTFIWLIKFAIAIYIVSGLLKVCASPKLENDTINRNTGYHGRSFPITTLINAKWKQTPLHLEIVEYLADENKNLFWDFISDVTNLETHLSDYDTESQRYNAALELLRNRLSGLQMSILKLIISMHSLTVRIQSQLQISQQTMQHHLKWIANKEELKRNPSFECSEAITYALIDSRIVCNLDELEKMIIINNGNNEAYKDNVPLYLSDKYSFDHIYLGTENYTRTIIVYSDIGSKSFSEYHKFMKRMIRLNDIRYIVRHYLPKNNNKNAKLVRLSGYGVELHLKSTEYKSQDDSPKLVNDDIKGAKNETNNGDSKLDIEEDTVDENQLELEGFRFNILKYRYPQLSHLLDQFRETLQRTNNEIAHLKAWEYQDLGLQAAAAVTKIDGDEALNVMQFISHNFPLQAKSLIVQQVTPEFRKEIEHNMDIFTRQLNVIATEGSFFINGIYFDADALDLNNIIEILRAEVRIMDSLHQNNLKGPIAKSFLTVDFSSLRNFRSASTSSSSNSINEFAIDIRDDSIIWINDIENDYEYRQWPSSVMDLLRPTFPGMLRNIRKNIFNLVLIVDPLRPSSRAIIKLAEGFIVHMAPLRIGIVFDLRQAKIDQERSVDYYKFIHSFHYIVRKKDGRKALGFLTDIFSKVNDNEWIKGEHIRKQFKKVFDKMSYQDLNEILNENNDDYDSELKNANKFIERLGFDSSPQALMNGVPVNQNLFVSENDFEDGIFSEILLQTNKFQKAVYKGILTDNDNILTYLMQQPHVMPRLNQRILDHADKQFLDFSGKPHMNLNNVNSLLGLSNRDMTATLLKNLKYFETKTSSEKIDMTRINFLTVWIVADLDNVNSRLLLENALRYLTLFGRSVRIAFIPNTEGIKINNENNLNRLVWAAMQSLPSFEATELVLKWLKQTPLNETSDAIDYEIPFAIHDILKSTELHIKMLRVYVQRVLGIKKSSSLVLSNGCIIGPLNTDEIFIVDDFVLLERFNAIQFADKMRHQLNTLKNDVDINHITSDIILKLYGNLVTKQSKTRFKIPDGIRHEHSVLKLPVKDPNKPYVDIVAILDPASRNGQKLTPILKLFRTILNCRLRVYMTPLTQHSAMPVTNFYRYVIEPEVQFLPNGALDNNRSIAKFTDLPINPLLTQNLQIPENWLVEVVRSVYDLDNIRLIDIGGPVHSEYELEYLLLEGHCFDSNSGSPPRGLQIILGTKDQPNMVDTIVMANLGYFQLKANPGVWWLRLRAGKSLNLYDITFAEGTNTIHLNGHTQIVISSLRSHVIKLRVTKKASMQNVDLLSDDDDNESTQSTGIWNSITSSLSGITDYVVKDESNSYDKDNIDGSNEINPNTINIFSVASGHLYERLLRIMMISLLKHTKSPVKFWFLKNYLSPQFTEFLPHMAREYHFQYELVQYKWPRWLHQQTEKQRTIWGYKILFLDVLFPLNVRKIIFVDADAIVRADLKILYDMNLNGAPYAYTPFCDSRKEMEGFRFWKQGYWRNHLMGRRYHISALYVVDLKRFRRIAAGDRLRGQYQALSQDPNSLANLDQDLPNNMIHQVSIKSLPDDWLWCETWCNDASLKNAKVIDLCNNPLTKEAKLAAAERIVPEWKTYDNEVKMLMARIEDHENAEDHHNENNIEMMTSDDHHHQIHSEL